MSPAEEDSAAEAETEDLIALATAGMHRTLDLHAELARREPDAARRAEDGEALHKALDEQIALLSRALKVRWDLGAALDALDGPSPPILRPPRTLQ